MDFQEHARKRLEEQIDEELNIGKEDSQRAVFQNAIGKSLDEIITEWHASLK